MDFKVSIVGLGVGILVGLSGMGGGALMTPALILLGWARPVVAVGTDLLWNTLTKSVGAVVHYRQKTVDLQIVKRLAVGSIPGALVGIAVLERLQRLGAARVDRMVVQFLGVALVLIALSLFIRTFFRVGADVAKPERIWPWWLTSLVGAVVGFLVSITSVGAGTLIVACLVVMYPSTPLRRIVGSDIFHAVMLVAVCSVGHLEIGSPNLPLLGALLLGSVPGVILGSKISLVVPQRVLQPILAGILFFLGYKLL